MASAAPRFGAGAGDLGAGAGVGACVAEALCAKEGVPAGGVGAPAAGAAEATDEGITTEGDGDAAAGMGVEGANEGADSFDSGPALDGCPIEARILDISWSFTSFAMVAALSAPIFRLSAIYGAKSCGSVSPNMSCPASAPRRPIWSICSACLSAMLFIMPFISLL
jgi:hypothetical protein